jgi:amidase
MSTSLPFPEYDQLDGLALADLIRRGEVSAAEVTEAAISRMAARNPALKPCPQPYNQPRPKPMSSTLPEALPFT